MIIWINGAFGSGKTQVAYELHKRIDNSFVFDPEEAGFYISSNMPYALSKDDFQDYPMWRSFNANMLEEINKEFQGIIICPMTVTNSDYLYEITKNLNIKHYSLIASAQTIEKRLRRRGEKKNAWAFKQIERCVDALSDEAFNDHIQTDNLSIDDVVEEIARRSKITLHPDTRSTLKKKMDRIFVWKKHIRIFG